MSPAVAPGYDRSALARTLGVAADAGEDQTPRWLRAGLFIAASIVLSFGTVGLLLACAGVYRPALVFPVGALLLAGVLVVGWRAVLDTDGVGSGGAPSAGAGSGGAPSVGAVPLAGTVAAIGLCVLVVCSAGLNIGFASNHVQVNRDAGAYAVTGKWIAEQGNLQIPAASHWAASGVPVTLSSLGTYSDAHGNVQLQFDHFVPVLFAEADNIGGDWLLFAMPALLGALGLIAVYVLGCRLVRNPWLVLAAVTALAVCLPQLSVSRDTYSETGTQVLLWTGLWLTLQWSVRPRLAIAVLAGMFLGATTMTRIDALVYFIPIPLLAGLLWHSARTDRRTALQGLGGFAAGVTPVAALGAYDLMSRSAGYYQLLHGQVIELRLGIVAAAIVGVGIALTWPTLQAFRPVMTRLRFAAPALAGLLLLALWFLRPMINHPKLSAPNDVVSGLQAAEGQPVDALRSYGEESMHWMAWYLGPIGLLLAIAGVMVLVARGQRAGGEGPLIVLFVVGLTSLLYLWQPSIVPDQIWAGRRYVPAVLPFLVISGAVGIEALGRLVEAVRLSVGRAALGIAPWFARGVLAAAPWLVRGVTAFAAITVVIAPGATALKVARFTAQHNYDQVADASCAAIGSDAAVVFEPGGRLEQTWPQTIRSWCGVPTAILAADATADQVSAIARTWRSSGRMLWVFSGTAAEVKKVAPNAPVRRIGAAVSTHELAQTISKLPDKYSVGSVTIYGAPVG